MGRKIGRKRSSNLDWILGCVCAATDPVWRHAYGLSKRQWKLINRIYVEKKK